MFTSAHLSKRTEKKIRLSLFLFSILLPLCIALHTVFSGDIAFWYDNARDLLLAWDNLSKPTLIGPTSGIPGFFYGPYWIWLLSIGIFFSKDPRAAVIIAGIIPYFLIFPFVLYQFSKLFGLWTVTLMWLFFIFSMGMGYATILWNPHLAPLLLLILLYLLLFIPAKHSAHRRIRILFAGIISGLLSNFHISLGAGVIVGVLIFFIIEFARNRDISVPIGANRFVEFIITICVYVFGINLTLIPFFIFEIRHGFTQLNTIFQALSSYGGVVTINGLSRNEIIQQFFSKLGELTYLNMYLAVCCLFVGTYIILRRKNQRIFSEYESRLVALLLSISSGILIIYLSAKNPVWNYHFFGVEIFFLFLIGVIIHRNIYLRISVSIWLIIIIGMSVFTYLDRLSRDIYASPSLVTKEYIVDTIRKDAKDKNYTVISLNPSIYQFDYSYLFRWRHKKTVQYDPNMTQSDEKIIYLIIPQIEDSKKNDFIMSKTPTDKYKTLHLWSIPDGTIILRREKIH